MECSSTTCNVQTLQNAPLLGIVETDKVYQEEHDMRADIALVVLASPLLVDDEQEEEEEEATSYCYNFLVIWVMFPLLLFVQFGVAFMSASSAQEDNNGDAERSAAAGRSSSIPSYQSWSTVNVCIVLFCLTCWLYRNACIDTKIINNNAMLMLPEIILNTVLILITLNKTLLSFYMLLLGMELLTVLAIIITIRFLYCSNRQVEDKDEVSKEDYIMMV